MRSTHWITICAVSLLFCALAHANDTAPVAERYRVALTPPDARAADQVIEKAREYGSSLRADSTWAQIPYKNQEVMVWKTADHLDRIHAMARAAHLLRQRGQTDKQLEHKALGALEWWLKNDPKNPNWWWNQIGTPQALGEIGLFLRPLLSKEQVDGIVEIMKRSDWKTWTGQNLVWGVGNQIARGCLQEDPRVVREAFNRLYDEVVIARDRREGIQPDYSFHQHGQQLYSGGYGINFAQDVGRYIFIAHGTAFQAPADKMEIYTHYILDGEQWMTWDQIIDYSTIGREITTSGKLAVNHDWARGPYSPEGAAYAINNIVRLLGQLDTPRKAEFAAFAVRLNGEDDAPAFVGNKHFWRSDYMAHRRTPYLFSIKMFSTRMQNAELVNNEGKKSHHLSDGATLLYRNGREYRELFPVWDWQRIPGTTAEQAPDGNLEKLLPDGNRTKGKTRFVGGVSNGSIGLAAMDLRRERLKARKAWLCLDSVIVCLGAGITCDSDNTVLTSVNQCRVHGAPVIRDGGKGWHDGVGYVGKDIKFSVRQQSGRWSDIGAGGKEQVSENVFSATIDHGKRPTDATYSYLLFPDTPTPDDLPDRIKQADVRILSNTPDIQAALSNYVFGAAFYQPGKVDSGMGFTVEVDDSCLLLITHDGNDLLITVSNPVNEPGTITVQISGRPAVKVQLPEGTLAGSSATVRSKLQ